MQRAHIAMVSIPAPGHVNPSLEILRELAARGHRVTYANDAAMKDVVESTGAEFKEYTSTLPRVNTAGAAEESDRTWDGDTIDQLTLFQVEYEAMLPQLRRLYENDRPDLFLYDIAGGPARVLAEEWEVPIVQLSPTYVAWEGYEDDMQSFVDTMRADPRGAVLYERQRKLLSDNGVETDPDEFYGRPARAVVLIGQHVDVAELGAVPGNVEVHRWVPQFDILCRADAFLTHAGMGGSSEGMFTGTPMIAAPQATDQFDNADALVAAGVAVRVDSSTVSPDELRDALERVDAEPVRTRSAELAAELRSAGGVDAAVRVIEDFL
jgi:UDP:flavonoid glycosyltransferase YjiC (YdhE family)